MISPAKVISVAVREFSSTALTAGFIIGGVVTPAVIAVLMVLIAPKLLDERVPAKITGEVLLIDRSGELAEKIAAELTPEAIAQYQSEQPFSGARSIEAAREAAEAGEQVDMPSLTTMPAPELKLVPLPADTRIEPGSGEVATIADEGSPRLLLVEIDPNAVRADPATGEFGGFQLFQRQRLNRQLSQMVERQIRDLIRSERLARAGLSVEEVRRLNRVERRPTQEVTETGETVQSLGEGGMIVGFGFMILLMISVFVGGQYLLTTTIEEKSSRVVELLLSAVSPIELMAGKIIGQMLVGMLLLGLYGGVAIAALAAIATAAQVITPVTLLLFGVFFLLAYASIASLMAAIGAAVNELREAQSLMAPVMAILGVPYLLGIFMVRNPDGTFSRVVSMLPGTGPFGMVMRLGVGDPAWWEIAVSIAVGVLFSAFCLWAAAKVFRVGLLMFGKPPNFRTLVRWVRMA